jgi:hypothetical protein
MSTHHEKRKCFIAGYYYESNDSFVMHFTEGEIYSYPSFAPELFSLLKLASQHGVLFNSNDRRPNRVSAIYTRIWEIPPGWTDSFS